MAIGILAKQIKPGDTSAENIALVRKTIEAYSQGRKNPRFTAEEKTNVDRYVMILYRHLGDEELNKELQRRASDSNRTTKERADAYAVLAGKSWDCAYRITSTKRALQKTEIENVERCVAFGMEYTDAAIRLDAENESAWSFKALILSERAKLYGLKNDQAAKALLQRQSDEAQKRATEVANARQDAESKEWARRADEEQKKNESKLVEESQKELTEYRDENSLEEVVKSVFFPGGLELSSLVAPVPIPEEKTGSQDKPPDTATTDSRPPEKGCFREVDGVKEKREWKSFTDGEIVVDLPDNVCSRGGGYIAASEGVMYSINPFSRPLVSAEPMVVNAVLNTMARTFIGFRAGVWLGNGPANAFEIKLLRKEDFNTQHRKIYGYALVNCSERKNGVLIVHAGNAHYYSIDISGMDESDPRTQRVLRSLQFK
jgi:hypothetical protein